MRTPSYRLLLIAAAGLIASPVFAGTLFSGDEEVDTKFRTKIMKEKAKQANQTLQERRQNQSDGNRADADCGSQNIGNVDTGGRPGSQPREVFVFAPNSINVVNSRGCN
ncbi:MAG: hypothetical protein ACKVQU_22615 [Burkholderiales bacterium]